MRGEFVPTEQAEQRLLLLVETDIPRADDPQMPRPEMLDSPPFEIRLDDRGAHVRRSGYRRRRKSLAVKSSPTWRRTYSFSFRSLRLKSSPSTR